MKIRTCLNLFQKFLYSKIIKNILKILNLKRFAQVLRFFAILLILTHLTHTAFATNDKCLKNRLIEHNINGITQCETIWEVQKKLGGKVVESNSKYALDVSVEKAQLSIKANEYGQIYEIKKTDEYSGENTDIKTVSEKILAQYSEPDNIEEYGDENRYSWGKYESWDYYVDHGYLDNYLYHASEFPYDSQLEYANLNIEHDIKNNTYKITYQFNNVFLTNEHLQEAIALKLQRNREILALQKDREDSETKARRLEEGRKCMQKEPSIYKGNEITFVCDAMFDIKEKLSINPKKPYLLEAFKSYQEKMMARKNRLKEKNKCLKEMSIKQVDEEVTLCDTIWEAQKKVDGLVLWDETENKNTLKNFSIDIKHSHFAYTGVEIEADRHGKIYDIRLYGVLYEEASISDFEKEVFAKYGQPDIKRNEQFFRPANYVTEHAWGDCKVIKIDKDDINMLEHYHQGFYIDCYKAKKPYRDLSIQSELDVSDTIYFTNHLFNPLVK